MASNNDGGRHRGVLQLQTGQRRELRQMYHGGLEPAPGNGRTSINDHGLIDLNRYSA